MRVKIKPNRTAVWLSKYSPVGAMPAIVYLSLNNHCFQGHIIYRYARYKFKGVKAAFMHQAEKKKRTQHRSKSPVHNLNPHLPRPPDKMSTRFSQNRVITHAMVCSASANVRVPFEIIGVVFESSLFRQNVIIL